MGPFSVIPPDQERALAMSNIFKTVTFGNRFQNSEKIIGMLRKDFVYKNICIENVWLVCRVK